MSKFKSPFINKVLDVIKTISNKILVFLKSPGMQKTYASLITIALSLIISFIVFIVTDAKNATKEFSTLVTGGLKIFGKEGFFDILANAAPLICCGLCVLFAFKTGLFNIGAAGQYVMGSFASLMFALQFDCPWYISTLMAIVFGAIWGIIPALLKAFCKVSEVISGIMLNWISLYFVNYSFNTYLKKGCINTRQGYKTFVITENNNAKLPDLGLKEICGNNFTIAIFIAIIAVIIIYIILEKTTLGYQIKASGLNNHATRYAGMNDKANLITTMAISGALAGLGGALFYLAGLEQWVAADSTALPGVPWNGIVIAFISQLSPIASIFVSIFISLISQGAVAMNQSIFPSEFGDLITGIIVYLSGLTAIIMLLIAKKKKKKIPLEKKGVEA